MAIIKNMDDLKPVLSTGKTLQSISKAAEPSGDSWEKFERVITGIDSLMQTAIQFNQSRQGITAEPPNSINGRPILANQPSTVKTKVPSEATVIEHQPQKDSQIMEIQNKLVEVFSDHVKKCATENPNMTLGECIMKLPVDVTQVSVLLSLLKKAV